MNLKFWSSAALALTLLISPARAQQATPGMSMQLKTGQVIEIIGLRINGRTAMVTVSMGGGQGEIGYNLDTIAKLNIPEPAALKAAKAAINAGKGADALPKLEEVLASQNDLRKIPGNWWVEAARLKLNALTSLGREAESDAILTQLAEETNDPQIAALLKIRKAASLSAKGDYEKALEAYEEILKANTNPDTLSSTWINKGDSLLALRKWEPAMLAYLRVPVLYPQCKAGIPRVLLGCARALVGMEENEAALDRLTQLVEQFPASPEAKAGKELILKLSKN